MEIKGAAELRARLLAIATEAPKRVAAGMYRIALRIQKRSMERTPVDLGALIGSHVTSLPVIRGNDISVQIAVGGPAAPYALVVHEDMSARHTVGEAKFLERSMHEAAPTFAEDLAREIGIEGLGR